MNKDDLAELTDIESSFAKLNGKIDTLDDSDRSGLVALRLEHTDLKYRYESLISKYGGAPREPETLH